MTKIMFFDMETTGLDPQKNAPIEFGAIISDEKLNYHKYAPSIHYYIKPFKGSKIEQSAMNINKIDLKGKNFTQNVISEKAFIAFLTKDVEDSCLHEKLYLAGWNVSFDVAFLEAVYKRVGVKYPFPHRTLDVQSVNCFMNDFKFESLVSVNAGVKHTSNDDINITFNHLRKLVQQRNSLKQLLIRKCIK